MTISAPQGPIIAYGQTAAIPAVGSGPALPSDYNPDRGYSAFDIGTGLLDARYGYKNGGNETAPLAFLFPSGGDYVLIDQVPSAVATANIAALANVSSGVAMTLVSSTGSGITVTTAATTIPQTGNVVASGALAIDSLPATIAYGQNGGMLSPDPRKALARAVSITGVTGGSGGNFTVVGADLYGAPQTETIAAGAGAGTVNGTKTFKFIISVTPQFSDAHNYSVGTADIFGFPLRVDEFAYVTLCWNNGDITANTGFVAADTTSPATLTTGDVRGTYAVQSSSDGTKKLQVFAAIPPWNATTITGVFGVTPV